MGEMVGKCSPSSTVTLSICSICCSVDACVCVCDLVHVPTSQSFLESQGRCALERAKRGCIMAAWLDAFLFFLEGARGGSLSLEVLDIILQYFTAFCTGAKHNSFYCGVQSA